MAQVFISYRRQESAHAAGRIYDRLREHLLHHHIFMDIDSIEPGVDFRKGIDAAIGTADVVLALIGPGWLHTVDNKGTRRLDNPDDSVRVEIASALRRPDIRLIPLVLDGASMPAAEELPSEIRGLADRNGIEIRHARFESDVGHLVEVLEAFLAKHPNLSGEQPRDPPQPEAIPAQPARIPDTPQNLADTIVTTPSANSSSHRDAAEPAAPRDAQPESPAPAVPPPLAAASAPQRRWRWLFIAAATAATIVAFWYGRADRAPQPGLAESAGQDHEPTLSVPAPEDNANGGLQQPSFHDTELPPTPAPEVAPPSPRVDSAGYPSRRTHPRLPKLSAGQDGDETILNQEQQREIIVACRGLVANDPKMIGEVAVELWIDTHGAVRKARLKDTGSPLNSAQVKECVLSKVRRLHFTPRPTSPGPVTRIFRFPD